MAIHAVICAVQIWHQRVSEKCRNITTALIITAMFLQIMISISAIQFLKYNQNHVNASNYFTPDFKVFNQWLWIEALVLASSVIANVIFLALRSCFQQKIVCCNENHVVTVESDFLEARQVEIGTCISFATPFICNLGILSSAFNFDLNNNEAHHFFELMIIQGAQTIFCYYIFFVSVLKAPDLI